MASGLLENLIKDEGVDHLSVTTRVKSMSSAMEKINRKGYDRPEEQLTDLTGIRVVTFLAEQADTISRIVRSSFEVDEENSQDKASVLGEDKVGYRSIHFVCSLGKSRTSLPEYNGLSNLKFEVQIRTVLQHAWAELAHDNTFKFETDLPDHLKRKLNLHSGLLEVADNAFQEIYTEIKSYKNSLSKKSVEQLENAPLDAIVLKRVLKSILQRENISIEMNNDAALLRELRSFGIVNVKDFSEIMTEKYISDYKNMLRTSTKNTTLGFVRGAMMYSDLKKYLSSPADWAGLNYSSFELLQNRYSADTIKKALQAAKKKLIPPEDDD